VKVEEEAVVTLAKSEDQVRPDDQKTDEELADEVIVEISVDGMCGVY
jgi:mycofactocin precursor